MNRSDLNPVDLHLIVMLREITVDTHKLNSVSFYPELFPNQLDYPSL